MKVFVTTHALSHGRIDEREVFVWIEGSGGHWHESRAAAVSRAESMRLNKLASLEKQIAKLRKLEFK